VTLPRALLGSAALLVIGLLAVWSAVVVMSRSDNTVQDELMVLWTNGTTPRRIVAFGTSLTDGNGWPDRLAENLTVCFAHPVEVLRVAKPGAGSTWGLEAVLQVIALSPDVVLMEFAINDADLRDGVGLSQSALRHTEIVSDLQTALPDAQIVLMTTSPAFGLRGWARPRLPQYYNQVVGVAEETGAAVMDFYPRWRENDLRDEFADGLHPSDSATSQIMDSVLLNGFANATGLDCDLVVRESD
jgi:acyl-CoA thioesterase-1